MAKSVYGVGSAHDRTVYLRWDHTITYPYLDLRSDVRISHGQVLHSYTNDSSWYNFLHARLTSNTLTNPIIVGHNKCLELTLILIMKISVLHLNFSTHTKKLVKH